MPSATFASLEDALRRIRLIEPYDISYVEDPFSESLAPLVADLRRRTGMLIGLGENLGGHRAFHQLIESGAVDVVRCDATVIGGVRELMAAASLASARGLEVSTHVHPHVHVHFGAALAQSAPGRTGVSRSGFRPRRLSPAARDATRDPRRLRGRAGSARARARLRLERRRRGTRVSDSWRGAPPPDRRLDDAASAAGPFTFPWDAPLFPPFPMQFRDASILTVCYRTDPAAIERLLPPPLERVGDVVVAHIYRMPDVDFAGCRARVQRHGGRAARSGRRVRRGRLLGRASTSTPTRASRTAGRCTDSRRSSRRSCSRRAAT